MDTTMELNESVNRNFAETSILSVNRSSRRMRDSVSSLFQRLSPRKSRRSKILSFINSLNSDSNDIPMFPPNCSTGCSDQFWKGCCNSWFTHWLENESTFPVREKFRELWTYWKSPGIYTQNTGKVSQFFVLQSKWQIYFYSVIG